MYRVCIYCGIAEVSRTTPCLGSAGHWFNNVPATPTFANVIQCPQCQRGEPCAENLKLTLEAENALLKRKLEIALRGLDGYGNEKNWLCDGCELGCCLDHQPRIWGVRNDLGYELARKIKAEIEEVK